MTSILENSIFILMIFFLVSWLYISFAIYFLPVIIAYARRHNNTVAILILNPLCAWTFVGWLVALFWALGENIKDKEE